MTVLIHVGQCGNQLGEAFWQLARDAYDEPSASADVRTKNRVAARSLRSTELSKAALLPSLYSTQFFHRRSRRARCILVDTEPKAIRAMLRGTKSGIGGSFEPAHVHYEQSGRGNNWAMGYNLQTNQRNVLPSRSGTSTASSSKAKKASLASTATGDHDKPELVELVMESMRQEIEALDVFRGTILMHSLGGGTGAGLGCRLLETMRDVYPRSYLTAVSVAPSCVTGDTPLQNYNALLTLQHLQENVDCVIYKENDELLSSALYWKALVGQADGAPSPPRAAEKTVTLREMNALVAADIAGLVFPVVCKRDTRSDIASQAIVARPFDMSKLVRECCPLPSTKFLETRTGVGCDVTYAAGKTAGSRHNPLFQAVPTHRSRGIDTDYINRLVRQTVESFPRRTSSARVIASCATVRHSSECDDRSLICETLRAILPPHHLRNHTEITFSSHPPFQRNGGGASVSIALNSGHATSSMSHFLDRGRRQFSAKAYVHWYKQYGLEDADFEVAFENCSRIVSSYEELLQS